MTTPLAPDVPSLDTFGAPFEDADAVVDPTTEMAASFMNRLVSQVAMLSHAAAKAWVRCSVSLGVATIEDHDAVWGDTNAVAPTVTYVGPGIFTITWATSYDDLQPTPESHSVNVRAVKASGYGPTPVFFNEAILGANEVQVYAIDATSSATDPSTFTVWIY